MSPERMPGSLDSRPSEQGIVLRRERETSDSVREVVEWITKVEAELLGIDAPYKKSLEALRKQHPESGALFDQLEDAVSSSGTRLSVAAQRLAHIDDETWNEGIKVTFDGDDKEGDAE